VLDGQAGQLLGEDPACATERLADELAHLDRITTGRPATGASASWRSYQA
jgi:hypothetical protein